MREIKELNKLVEQRIELEKQFISEHRSTIKKKIEAEKSRIKLLQERILLPDGVEDAEIVEIDKNGNLVIKTPDSAYPPDHEHQSTFNVKRPHY